MASPFTKGLHRFSIAAFLLLGLIWTRNHLAAMFDSHSLINSAGSTSFDRSRNPTSPGDSKSTSIRSKDPMAASNSLPERPLGVASAAGDERRPFAAVLGSIVRSLEENVSRPEHEPGFRQTRDKVVVVGKLKHEDTDWIAAELPDWQHAIYTVDDRTAPLHTQRNKGREANAYLTYIIEHYDSLPSVIAFIHSHHQSWPQSWHTDAPQFSNSRSLKALNTDFVERSGYVNLRCQDEPGCHPQEIQPSRKDKRKPTEVIFADAWKTIFNETVVPEAIAVACCAQFAVTREQIRKRSRDEYLWYHHWLMETELADEISGRVFEYLYHVIFGKDPVYCPPVAECYQDVYNRAPVY